MGTQNASDQDELQVTVNGRDIGTGVWNDGTLTYQPDPAAFQPGENQIAVRLSRREPQTSSAQPILIESLEVKVDYRE